MGQNDLTVFQSQEFGTVRTITENGITLFCGSDVAKALGYLNTSKALNNHCRYVTKRYIPHPQNPSKQIEMTFIPEGDLYRLIVNSKLPSAEKFERWLFDEVLPSIRKQGAYMTPATLEKALTNPDFLIQLATTLKTEQTRRMEAEAKVQEQQAILIEQRPKVAFADSVSASSTSILIGELAKILCQNGYETGEKRFYETLRNDGFLIRRQGSDRNMPTQRAMDMGLFEIKETAISHSDGRVTVQKTPKVTGKGQIYFINRYKVREPDLFGG